MADIGGNIARSDALDIISALSSNGEQAYFAGKCVRNKIMGIEPDANYCIATDARFSLISELFGSSASDECGLDFTACISREEHSIGIVPLHETDSQHNNNMNVDIEFAEFTIDALYEDADGNIYDPTFTARKDIGRKIVKLIHSDAAVRDPMCIMRAVILVSELGFRLESGTEKYCRDNVRRLAEVPKYIVGAGLKAVLEGKHAPDAIQYMFDLGIFDFIGLSELSKLRGCPQTEEWHLEGDALSHTMLVCRAMNAMPHDCLDMCAALMHDCGKPACTRTLESGRIISTGHEKSGAELARRLLASLCWDGKDISRVCHVIESHMQAHRAADCLQANHGAGIPPEVAWLMQDGCCDRIVRLCDADDIGSINISHKSNPLLSEMIERLKANKNNSKSED